MVILNSTLSDIDCLFKLYDDATAHMKQFTSTYWRGFERSLVEAEINEGRQYKIIENGEIACVFVITFNDPTIWQEADADPAIYIHRIATNKSFRGNNYVQHIVNWAINYALKNGKDFLRLDTGADNEKINNYYISCGFTFKGVTGIAYTDDLPEHYRNGKFSLFEIDLKNLKP
jgi:ribosomal protein S18 acetylase RimI-like enzyme